MERVPPGHQMNRVLYSGGLMGKTERPVGTAIVSTISTHLKMVSKKDVSVS